MSAITMFQGSKGSKVPKLQRFQCSKVQRFQKFKGSKGSKLPSLEPWQVPPTSVREPGMGVQEQGDPHHNHLLSITIDTFALQWALVHYYRHDCITCWHYNGTYALHYALMHHMFALHVGITCSHCNGHFITIGAFTLQWALLPYTRHVCITLFALQ